MENDISCKAKGQRIFELKIGGKKTSLIDNLHAVVKEWVSEEYRDGAAGELAYIAEFPERFPEFAAWLKKWRERRMAEKKAALVESHRPALAKGRNNVRALWNAKQSQRRGEL